MMARPTIAFACLLATTFGALAQDRPQPSPDPRACAPQEHKVPGAKPPGALPSTTGENLSDRLARTDGVLCPPNVDPGIKAPTPEVGKMPVIPPPGAPGGDQSVRPK